MTAEQVGRLERILSRAVLLVGLGALAAVAVISGRIPPPGWTLVLLGGILVAKLLVLLLGLRARWRMWPAIALELAAIGAVAGVVVSGRRLPVTEAGGLLVVIPVALLLGAAYALRWRVQRTEPDEGRADG